MDYDNWKCNSEREDDSLCTEDAEFIGRFIQSIESDWIGRVDDVEIRDGEIMLKATGVDYVAFMGNLTEFLTDDDTRWFAPEDVEVLS